MSFIDGNKLIKSLKKCIINICTHYNIKINKKSMNLKFFNFKIFLQCQFYHLHIFFVNQIMQFVF